MSYPVAFYVIEDGKEKFLAQGLNDDFTFEDDMFAPSVVQAQNSDDEQQTKSEFANSGSSLQLNAKSFPAPTN